MDIMPACKRRAKERAINVNGKRCVCVCVWGSVGRGGGQCKNCFRELETISSNLVLINQTVVFPYRNSPNAQDLQKMGGGEKKKKRGKNIATVFPAAVKLI